MNDKLIMDNYLLILKSTVEVYIHGTLEASNEEVKKLLKENLNDILTCQKNTYNQMTSFGWYPVENVNISEITKTLDKVKQGN